MRSLLALVYLDALKRGLNLPNLGILADRFLPISAFRYKLSVSFSEKQWRNNTNKFSEAPGTCQTGEGFSFLAYLSCIVYPGNRANLTQS